MPESQLSEASNEQLKHEQNNIMPKIAGKSESKGRKPTKTQKKTRPRAGHDKKPQSKRKFIQQEAGALFSEYGYAAATMDQLSERTGLNKATLYYYYTSKADILYDFCVMSGAEKSIQLIQAALKMERAEDGLEYFTQIIVTWVLEHRNEVRVYFKEWEHFEQIFDEEQFEVARKQRSLFTSTLTKVIKKGIKNGEFRISDPEIHARFIIGSILWLYQWVTEEETAEELTPQIFTFIKRGLNVP